MAGCGETSRSEYVAAQWIPGRRGVDCEGTGATAGCRWGASIRRIGSPPPQGKRYCVTMLALGVAAKSNAQRQAEFRARRSRDARPVQLWLGEADRLALARLARHWDVTRAEAVARLVRGADREAAEGMDDASFEAYLG